MTYGEEEEWKIKSGLGKSLIKLVNYKQKEKLNKREYGEKE